jgi:hypothetical protein
LTKGDKTTVISWVLQILNKKWIPRMFSKKSEDFVSASHYSAVGIVTGCGLDN